MLNQVVLVGRINNEPAGMCDENQHNFTMIELVVPRSYKNADGIYENDNIEIKLYDTITTTTMQFVHKNDLVGIKGRLQNDKNKLIVIAEKVTFLSSKKEEKEEQKNE